MTLFDRHATWLVEVLLLLEAPPPRVLSRLEATALAQFKTRYVALLHGHRCLACLVTPMFGNLLVRLRTQVIAE